MAPVLLVPLGCWVFALDRFSDYLISDHLSEKNTKLFLRLCIGLFLLCASFFVVIKNPSFYVIPELLFISLLGVTLFTDTRVMLISRLVTLYTIPLAFALCIFNILPLSLLTSFIGALFGYGILKIVSIVALKSTGKEGLGEGDIDLLAMIGAYTGPLGCWASLLIGSVLGAVVGIVTLATGADRSTLKLPFGTFLGIGAIVFVLFYETFHSLWQI